MNIIYIIFIIVILFSFVTGLFVTIAERHERKKYVELLEEEEIEENEEENNPVQDSIPAVPIVMENDDSLDVPSTNNVVLEDVNNNQINNVNPLSVSEQNNVEIPEIAPENVVSEKVSEVPEVIPEAVPEISIEPISKEVDSSITNSDNKEPTLKIDNLEVLEKTIKLNVIPENSSSLIGVSPQLVPYSIVDDDII